VKVPPFEEVPFLDTHPLQRRTLLRGFGCQVPGIRCPVSGVRFLGQDYRRVVMGLPPTRANENHPCRHPRESGGPFSIRNTMDSRLRGNDVIFGGAGVHRSKRPRASTEKLACGVPGSRKRGRAEKMLKIAGTNSTTPLESTKVSKKRTQNELILHAKKSN
jgi:hypothetical protein